MIQDITVLVFNYGPHVVKNLQTNMQMVMETKSHGSELTLQRGYSANNDINRYMQGKRIMHLWSQKCW